MDKNGFLIELSESDRTDFGRVDFADQPEPQKVFSAIWELESQVNNGGFDQFFRNSESDVLAYAPVALAAIGAKSCASIVQQALAVISPLPPTHEERTAALDALDDDGQQQLEALDEQFFAYPDNLTDLLFAYVSRHPENFGPLPQEGFLVRQVDNYPLWLGNAGDVRDPRALLTVGIAAVVDLALNEAPVVLPREIVHCRFPLVDGGGNPPWLLRAAAETVASLLRAGVPTLVVCGAGMSRTPAVAAAAFALVASCSPAEALAHVARTGAADVSGALWAEIQAAIK